MVRDRTRGSYITTGSIVPRVTICGVSRVKVLMANNNYENFVIELLYLENGFGETISNLVYVSDGTSQETLYPG